MSSDCECQICLQEFTSTGPQSLVVFTSCAHGCCLECYQGHYEKKKKDCHLCRVIVTGMQKSYSINGIIEEKEKEKQKYEELSRQMKADFEEKTKKMELENQRLQNLLAEDLSKDTLIKLDKQRFRDGDMVKIINLEKQKTLNGCIGEILGVNEEKDNEGNVIGIRFSVEIEGKKGAKEKISVKPMNLVLATLQEYVPINVSKSTSDKLQKDLEKMQSDVLDIKSEDDIKDVKKNFSTNVFTSVRTSCDAAIKDIKPDSRVIPNLGLGGNYGDGDQTKLSGVKGQQFRVLWSGGMDIHEHLNNGFVNCNDPIGHNLLLQCCFFGEAAKLEQILLPLSTEEKIRLLERRISRMRFSCLFVLIYGSKVMKPNPVSNYVRCLEILIEHGIDLNVKDCAGYTPIHHCFSSSSGQLTQSLGEIILKTGVSPNVQNRMGGVPLHECVMGNMVAPIKILLKYGADPEIADYDGAKPSKMCIFSSEISGLFHKQLMRFKEEKKKLKKDEKKPEIVINNTNYRTCEKCNKKLPSSSFSGTQLKKNKGAHCMVCTGQAKSHEIEIVKEVVEEKLDKTQFLILAKEDPNSPYLKTVNLHTNPATGKSSASTMSTSSKQPKANVKFIVKIQTPMGPGDLPLMIYNQDRSVKRYIDVSDPSYNLIRSIVLEKGCLGGIKAYFTAFFNNQGELCFCYNDVQPIQDW
jgi:hypothetical protein